MKKVLLLMAFCSVAAMALAQETFIPTPTYMADGIGLNDNSVLPDGIEPFASKSSKAVAVIRELPPTANPADDLALISFIRGGRSSYGIPQDITNVFDDEGTFEPPVDEDDLSATWYAVYSQASAMLYVVVDVTDDVLWTGSAQSWQDDNVEVFVDFDNSKIARTEGQTGNQAYDSNDGQFRIRPVGDTGGTTGNVVDGDALLNQPSWAASFDGVCYAADSAAYLGYTALFKISMVDAGAFPFPNGEMGIEVQVADDDDDGERDSIIGWTVTSNVTDGDSAYPNPNLWGNGYLYTFTDVRIAQGALTVDADPSDWDGVTSYGATFLTAGSLGATPGAWADADDFHAEWRAAWDSTGLWILTVITDDVLSTGDFTVDPPVIPAGNSYDRDCVEMFVDYGNSKNQINPSNIWQGVNGVDPTNDQVRVVWDEGQNGGALAFDYAWATTADGWLVEWAFPWSSFGATVPSPLFGFDVHFADNDAATTAIRENILSWFEQSQDNAWRDASVFGTLRLVTGPTSVTSWQDLDR